MHIAILGCSGAERVLRNMSRRPWYDPPFVWQCDGYTTHFYVFGTLIPNMTSKISDSKKIVLTGHLNFKISRGTKKSNFENCNKKGACGLQMTRRCRIWSKYLNRTTFDPLLAKNVETDKFQFWSFFFTKKGVK